MEQFKTIWNKMKNADFFLDQQQGLNASTSKYTIVFLITFMFLLIVKEMHNLNPDIS